MRRILFLTVAALLATSCVTVEDLTRGPEQTPYPTVVVRSVGAFLTALAPAASPVPTDTRLPTLAPTVFPTNTPGPTATQRPQATPPPVTEPAPTSKAAVLPQYTVLLEDIYDVPIKTQVVLDVLVSGEISDFGLRALLSQLYSSTKARTGFTYHDSPTIVFIYLFTSRDRAQSGMRQWIAMLAKGYDDAVPTITVDERQIAQLGAEPVERFGLSEEQREEIWREIIRADHRAIEEAERRYPYPYHEHLEVGSTYRLSKGFNLMPEIHSSDPIASLDKVRSIPAGATVLVLDVASEEDPPWYHVQVGGVGEGWINSAAMYSSFEQESQQRLLEQIELEANLIDEYEDELAQKHGLTREQLHEILLEGTIEGWPFP